MAIFRGSGGSIDGQTESLSLPVAISQGGTGATSAANAINNLVPAQANNSGKYLTTNGVTVSWDNIDINSADISGTLPIVNGGTGATSASSARTALGLSIGTDIPATDGTGATGTWGIDVSGNAATVTNGVYTTGNQTIGGVKTFSSTIVGDISGNAGTVTNGLYSTGSYSNPSWISSLDGSKLTGTVVATNGLVSTGSYSDPSWLTSLAGSKITGDIAGNAGTVTNGVYTTGSYSDPIWISSLSGSKISGNISGNAANVTGTVSVGNGGTGATTASGARTNLLPSYSSNTGKVLAVNGSGTDVEWVAVGGSGTVTSVAMTVPTGLTVSGSPINTTGTLAVSYATGYSIPTDVKQGQWDNAYSWGNHALAGYALDSSVVKLTGDQTIAGIKTFSSTIVGSVNGNAGTVTNGVYTTGSYADPSWITSLSGTKLTGTVVATNGVVTTGSYSDPSWITSLSGSKISGNISGNAANVTGTVAVANGGTGATSLTGYIKGNGTSAMTAVSAISGSDVDGGTINGGTF